MLTLVAAAALGCQGGAQFDARDYRDPGAAADGASGNGASADAAAAQAPDAGFGNSAFDARAVAPDPDAAVPFEVCAQVEARAQRIVPSVTLVIDGSGSMRCAYPEPSDCSCDAQLRDQCSVDGAGVRSRWQALSEALFGAPGGPPGVVERLDGVVRFGMVVYHDPVDAPACPTLPVDIALDLDRAAALTAGFPAEPPGANTPTALALDHVLSALPAVTPDAPQHVVLATDGKPYVCFDSLTLEPPALDYGAVEALAGEASAAEVALHVLSLAPADGDFAAHLDAVASLGGTQAALLPADGDALVAQLEQVITGAISCEVVLQGEVADDVRCDGEVTLAGEALACDGADGYRLVDSSHVELLGAACDRFRRDPDATLSVRFPCELFTPR
jgi:hypothetical protein